MCCCPQPLTPGPPGQRLRPTARVRTAPVLRLLHEQKRNKSSWTAARGGKTPREVATTGAHPTATRHPQGAEPSRSSRPCLLKAVVWLGLLLLGMAVGAGALGAALCSCPSPLCIAGILNRIQPSASRLLSRFWEQRLLYGKRLKRKQNKFCSEDQILFPSFLPSRSQMVSEPWSEQGFWLLGRWGSPHVHPLTCTGVCEWGRRGTVSGSCPAVVQLLRHQHLVLCSLCERSPVCTAAGLLLGSRLT